jgi:hypothetical protein
MIYTPCDKDLLQYYYKRSKHYEELYNAKRIEKK